MYSATDVMYFKDFADLLEKREKETSKYSCYEFLMNYGDDFKANENGGKNAVVMESRFL